MSCFYISTIGQLQSVYFPVGPSSRSVHCRYEVVHGPDWELISGQKSGITQCASVGNSNFHTIIFNMPLEFTFKSTNPFGCKLIIYKYPQKYISIKLHPHRAPNQLQRLRR